MSHSTTNSMNPQQGSLADRSVASEHHSDHASIAYVTDVLYANTYSLVPQENHAPTQWQRECHHSDSLSTYYETDQQQQTVQHEQSITRISGYEDAASGFPWMRGLTYPPELIVEEDPSTSEADGRPTQANGHGPPPETRVEKEPKDLKTEKPSEGHRRGSKSKKHPSDGHRIEPLPHMTERYLRESQRDEPFPLIAYPDHQRGSRH